MCHFLSFLVVPTRTGLKAYASPELDSHDDARHYNRLKTRKYYEVEWVLDLEVRIPDDEPQAKREMIEQWVVNTFGSRNGAVRHFTNMFLKKGIIPTNAEFVDAYPKDIMLQWACDCVQVALKYYHDLHKENDNTDYLLEQLRNSGWDVSPSIVDACRTLHEEVANAYMHEPSGTRREQMLGKAWNATRGLWAISEGRLHYAVGVYVEMRIIPRKTMIELLLNRLKKPEAA